MHLTSCGTLVILITSTGEFLLYFTVIFFSVIKKKKQCCRIFFCVVLCAIFIQQDCMSSGLEMEHLGGEQYSEYLVERNPRAYMSMRDYRNLPWQGQQPMERNPNTYRSMRDYRNQWMGAPLRSVSPTNAPFDNTYNPSWGNHTNSSWEPRPPQYAPPPHPQYASSS